MAETIYDHPRLKVQFLQFFRKVIFRIEAQQGHELSIGEDIAEEISELEYNIYFADKCEYDHIKQSGHLKHDPLAWSSAWSRYGFLSRLLAYTRQHTPRAVWH